MKAINKHVLIKIDMLQKEKLQLTKDVFLTIQKGYNFNLREDRSTIGYVINGCDMPEGAPILVHYLATEPSYAVDNENILTEEEKAEGFKVRNIPLDMVFCHYENEKWIPCKGFLITKRIFKEYKGIMQGIPHEQVKHRLYIESGFDEWDGEVTDLSGKVCVVGDSADIELIWHNPQHREERLIKTRHRDILGVDEGLEEKVKAGEYLIGISPTNCSVFK